ncbi:MAG: hypothetical protein JHC31_06115, partial [Sulfurihydrogenibium sp.]|nr:hypothetical protein [Sulfurihydrogenibium sp.]
FNPSSPYQNQVATELNTANTNFSILGQAFYNNDPTSQPILRASYTSSSAPSNPVAGMTWLDTSTNPPTLKVYDGNNWQSNVVNATNSTNANYSSNSDKVDGFHANQTPSPNVIVPLNSSGVLDLSSTYVKSNVYSFRRIDLSNVSSDYTLQVGEEAYISFNNSSSVALHIATQNGAIYEILLPDSAQPTYLYPNNTSYSNQFTNTRLYTYSNNSSQTVGTDGDTTSGFKFYSGINRIIVFNNTGNKRVIARYGDCGGKHIGISSSYWNDTSTNWVSLGTFSFNWSFSGFVLVRRLV